MEGAIAFIETPLDEAETIVRNFREYGANPASPCQIMVSAITGLGSYRVVALMTPNVARVDDRQPGQPRVAIWTEEERSAAIAEAIDTQMDRHSGLTTKWLLRTLLATARTTRQINAGAEFSFAFLTVRQPLERVDAIRETVALYNDEYDSAYRGPMTRDEEVVQLLLTVATIPEVVAAHVLSATAPISLNPVTRERVASREKMPAGDLVLALDTRGTDIDALMARINCSSPLIDPRKTVIGRNVLQPRTPVTVAHHSSPQSPTKRSGITALVW